MENFQLEVKKIRTPRDARRIEQILQKRLGIHTVSAAVPGTLQLRWDTEKTSKAAILDDLEKSGLEIVNAKAYDEETEQHDHEHFPSHLRFLGDNTELYFAIISGVCWLSGLVLGFISAIPANVPMILFIVGAFFGGFFTFITAGSAPLLSIKRVPLPRENQN
jgi:Cd2+/Zn2+-exporting ATPase